LCADVRRAVPDGVLGRGRDHARRRPRVPTRHTGLCRPSTHDHHRRWALLAGGPRRGARAGRGRVREGLTVADVVTLLDEIRAIARSGLHYAENPFDRARCERLLEIAAQGYDDVTGLESEVVRARFLAETGYATAKVGADGAVFDDDGRVLLIRRADDGLWGLVAGWVDPNEAPEQTIVREFGEELGVVGHIEQFVGTCF